MNDLPDPEPSARVTRAFLLNAAATGFVYAGLAVFFARDTVGGAPILSNGVEGREHVVWIATSALLLLHLHGWRLVQRHAIPTRTIFAAGVVFTALALAARPFHSQDLFSYVSLGWAQLQYELNPYLLPIDVIPDWEKDPMFLDHVWSSTLYPYGFFFARFAKLVCWLGGGDPSRTVLLFKVLMAGAHVGVAALVARTAARLGVRRPRLALYACLCSPILLIHGVTHGHNDLLVSGAVVLAVYLLVAGRSSLSIPALAVGTLVKYAPGPTLPFFVAHLAAAKRWKELAIGAALSCAVVAALAWPYREGASMIDLGIVFEGATRIHGSVLAVLPPVLDELVEVAPALASWKRPILRAAFRLPFYLYGLWLLVATVRVYRKGGSRRETVRAIVLSQLLLILVVSRYFLPWYVGMFLPLALLLEEDDVLRRIAWVLSLTHLFDITSLQASPSIAALALTVLPVALVLLFRERPSPAA